MTRLLAVATRLAVLASPAAAQKFDAAGRCRGPNGKSVKMGACKPAPAAAAAGRCRDVKTKTFAKWPAPHTEAGPVK